MKRRLAVPLLVALVFAFSAPPTFAYDVGGGGGTPEITLVTWTSGAGHSYVGAKVGVNGSTSWVPGEGNPSPYYAVYPPINPGTQELCLIEVRLTADGSVVSDDPIDCGTPIIGGTFSTNAGLGGYLGVSVDPASGPANTDRTVTATVATNYVDGVDAGLRGYIDPSSVHISSWDFDYGDGTGGTYSSGSAFELAKVHKYGAGSYQVNVAAHMSGTVSGAFYDGNGQPYESSEPFTVTLTNDAATSGAPIEYVPPVITVASDPTSDPTAPGCDGNCPSVPRGKNLVSFYWLRGLPCTVYAAPIVVAEGYMRSAGVRIGGAHTVLASYDFSATVNDRNPSVRSANGTYAGGAPIEIQWNVPLGNNQPYTLSYTYHLVTTYDDGTVRDYTVSGGVGVVIVYSVMG